MSHNIYTISHLKEKLIPVSIDNSIKRAILFGAYGKGSTTEESDTDLLVDSDLKGLRFAGLIEAIREAVDKDVDIFDITHVKKGFKIDLETQKTGVLMYEKRCEPVWEIICNDSQELRDMLICISEAE